MDKNTIIKVANRDSGTVCYSIPDLKITRHFMPRETKEVPFGELESLSFQPGGLIILSDFLVIRNEDAAAELLGDVEPEYFYSAEDVKRLLETGSYEEFLDCLDFAPEGVLEMVKTMAVDLPLNDVAKRSAILDKLNFNVTAAINIKNTKFDGEADNDVKESNKPQRRVNKETKQEGGRRTDPPKYNIIK